MFMLDQDRKDLSVRQAIPRAKLRIAAYLAMNLYTDSLGEPLTRKEEISNRLSFVFDQH